MQKVSAFAGKSLPFDGPSLSLIVSIITGHFEASSWRGLMSATRTRASSPAVCPIAWAATRQRQGTYDHLHSATASGASISGLSTAPKYANPTYPSMVYFADRGSSDTLHQVTSNRPRSNRWRLQCQKAILRPKHRRLAISSRFCSPSSPVSIKMQTPHCMSASSMKTNMAASISGLVILGYLQRAMLHWTTAFVIVHSS